MIFDKTSFNVIWAASLTRDQFIKFPGNQLLWENLTDKERKSKLGQVWDLIQAKTKSNENHLKSLNGKPKT